MAIKAFKLPVPRIAVNVRKSIQTCTRAAPGAAPH
jgi:hypothetical protein